MQTKTKIIHLIGSLNPGGVQTYILNISNYDKIHNIRREVWTLYQKKGLLYTEFLKKNINVSACQIIPADKNWRPYFLWKWLRYFASVFYFLQLFRKLKISKPDLVILDEPVRILTQFFILRLLNIPMIWNIHAEKSLTKNKISHSINLPSLCFILKKLKILYSFSLNNLITSSISDCSL